MLTKGLAQFQKSLWKMSQRAFSEALEWQKLCLSKLIKNVYGIPLIEPVRIKFGLLIFINFLVLLILLSLSLISRLN